MAVGATVTITNTSTGIVTRSVTSDTGILLCAQPANRAVYRLDYCCWPLWAPNRRRGISDFNVPRNLVLNYLIELPNVRKDVPVAPLLLNSWQWGGIFQTSVGEPFTPLISGDPLNLHSNDVFAFPDRLTGTGCSGNPGKSVTPFNRQYVNISCFAFYLHHLFMQREEKVALG
jgi:hypothetical protein